MPPRIRATKTKISNATKDKALKTKARPTLDDVVNQLISLQGYGITQDSSLLQMCHTDTSGHMHDRKPDHSASPTIEAMIGPIIGIDEAGRGCLAGPVVAAAVILPHGPLQSELMHSEPTSTIKSHLCMTPHLESLGLGGLADSKKLTEAQRDALAPRIRQHAVAWGLGVVWPSTIDEINILQSTFLAMARAVNSMHRQGALMLIDGNKTIPASAFHASQAFQHNGIDKSATPQHAIVGGDDIVPAISAASILAKTYRDKLMVAFDKRYPAYGFAKHKGYGTKDHLAALMEHGPCPQHRITFRGVVQEHGENPSPITQATPLLLC